MELDAAIAQIVLVIVGAAVGYLSSTLLTWIKYLGISEEDAARITNSTASWLNVVLTIGLTYVITLIIGLLEGQNLPVTQVILVMGVGLLGSNQTFVQRKKLGVKV